MIDLYYWPTPNGHKVSIFLEETATPYRVAPVNIRKGEQFAPDFLKISPNNLMPAIVDTDGPGGKPLSLFESGAILLYLAEKIYPISVIRLGTPFETSLHQPTADRRYFRYQSREN